MDRTPLGYGVKNCTNDTLYFGISEYDNIDSVRDILTSDRYIYDTCAVSEDLSLWNGENLFESDVYPNDSAGCIYHVSTFPCYIFIIKRQVAKQFSWEEIRAKGLYDKCCVTEKDFNNDHIFEYRPKSSGMK